VLLSVEVDTSADPLAERRRCSRPGVLANAGGRHPGIGDRTSAGWMITDGHVGRPRAGGRSGEARRPAGVCLA